MKRFALLVVRLLLYILIALVLVSNIIIWVPFYLYKNIVICLVRRYKNNELTGILCPNSTVFADEGYVTSPNPNSIFLVSLLKLKGNLSLSQLQNLFQDNVIDATLDGQCRYPELRQYPVSFMGYWFWKWGPAFNIKNHVFDSEKIVRSAEDVHEYMLNMPLAMERSPWEAVIFKTTEDEDATLVAVRINHCLGDGRSLVKLIVECLAQKSMSTAVAKKPFKENLSLYDKLVVLPTSAVRLTFDAIVFRYLLRDHPWRVRNYKADSSPSIVRMSGEVELDKINSASKRNGNACTSAFIMAAVAGAIKGYGDKYNFYSNNIIPMFCTLPKPNHPPCLKNHVVAGLFQAPTHLATSYERLKECDKTYCHLREDSLDPICMERVAHQGTAFVKGLRTLVPGADILVTGMTSMAGENEEIFVGGCRCLDYSFSVGLGRSSAGVLFVICSYRRKIRICVTAKQSVMDEYKVESLVSILNNELKMLTR